MIAGISCAECAYFVPPEEYAYRARERGGLTFGQCRRLPPIQRQTDQGPRSAFPLVALTWWCGEHAINPDLDPVQEL